MMREQKTLVNKGASGIDLSYGTYYAVCLVYLMLPVLIFILGWIRPLISIPCCLALSFVTFLSIRSCRRDEEGKTIPDGFKTTVTFIVVLAVFAILITLISNIGEFVWGTTDHAYRKAIFSDLVHYDWPVYYDLTAQSNPEINAMLPDETVFFSYYISFWMVPALMGKLLGFAAGNIALVIWSAFGIFLILTGMTMIVKKSSYAVIFTFVFFCGFDYLPYLYYQSVGPAEWMWLEGWTRHIVYIGNMNNLLNVYNQCIPCWLIVVLFLLMRNRRSAGLLGSLMFPYSPWATIGILPVAAYYAFRKGFKARNFFTAENILSPLILAGLFIPLYLANSNATSVKGTTVGFYGSIGAFAVAFLLTVAVEILPAFILLFKDRRKDPLFWVVIITLLILPFYKISGQNDLTMRGSMPEFFVLTIFLAATIARVFEEKKNDKSKADLKGTLKTVGGFVMLLAMSMVAFQMLLLTVVCTFDGSRRPNDDIGSLGDIRTPSYVETIDKQFFVYDYEDSFFCKYLAREQR